MAEYAIITGGSKGIGEALVLKFLENGFNVLTCARGQAGLEALSLKAKSINNGGQLSCCACDLSKKEGRTVLSKAIERISEPIKVLINNTGTYVPGELHNEAEGTLEQMIETNLYSAYYVTRMVVDDMMRQKEGAIFNMCSTASIMAYPNGGAYSVSKFALLGFSKGLREELKSSNVKVTAVLPGPVLTPSWDGVDVPAERLMKPSDIADAIWATYCLSDRTVVEEIVLRPQLGDL